MTGGKKRVFAHVIKEKGVHDYAVDRLELEIRNLGYKRLILKSDQEAAIMSVVGEVIRMRAANGGIGRTIEETSPVGSSSSNGIVERALLSVQEQVRVMSTALEHRWGSEHPRTMR